MPSKNIQKLRAKHQRRYQRHKERYRIEAMNRFSKVVSSRGSLSWFLYVLRNIKARCKQTGKHFFNTYRKKGITCFLTVEDLKNLWERDKGHLLSKPSIDRIDSDGHYELSNCRFIEFKENTLLGVRNRKNRTRVSNDVCVALQKGVK